MMTATDRYGDAGNAGNAGIDDVLPQASVRRTKTVPRALHRIADVAGVSRRVHVSTTRMGRAR